MNKEEKEYFEEKRLSGKTVYQGRLLRVEEDSVLLPNGLTSTREYIRHPGAVAILPVLAGGSVILVRQYRYPLAEVILEAPAGKLEKGEDILHAAQRELAEETGYTAGKWCKLGVIATTPGFTDELIHLYLAEELVSASPNPDEDEIITCFACPQDELRRKIADGEIYDAKTLCLLFHYFKNKLAPA